MNYLSVCSGIEAATVAWHPLGWTPVAFSEIEKFPSEVLKHHYPQVPNVGDMTKFKEWNLDSNVDVFVGGTPCQSFSVAGLRKGLDDPRGNLMLTYLAIADKYRPKWLVWENVAGVLSSNGGKDFGTFLGGLGELGYGFAYRILDAQYFGVAQRRRRVFVVGCLGDWRSAAAVLFERHSLSGNFAPSRKKGESATASIERSPPNSNWPAEISSTLDTTFGTKQGLEHQHVNAGCPMFVPVEKTYGIPGNWIGRKPENGGNATEPMHNIAPCLTKTDQHGVAQNIAYDMKQHHNPQLTNTIQLTTKNCSTVRGDTPLVQGIDLYNGAITGDITATMSTHGGDGYGTGPTVMQQIAVGNAVYEGHGKDCRYTELKTTLSTVSAAYGMGGENIPLIKKSMAVRRLTAKECERLQGFPDNYTDIKPKGKATPDAPRYKALGNSMAVPVMAWIGKRIQEVENIKCKPNK
jgi:DNA (cytosine-5)-methyltransferase 1